jgi:Carbohydrate family 9 binding domain-like
MTIYRFRAVLLSALAGTAVCNPKSHLGQSVATENENQYSSSIEIGARYSAADFAPDGNLEKKFWKNANWIEFDRDKSGNTEKPIALTRVAAAWTDHFTYFAFFCRYDSLNIFEGEDTSKERWELWNRDVVEVFLNPEPERMTHYYEFEVAPNNQWIDLEIEKKNRPFNDASWNSSFEHATRIDAKRHTWTAEMRIPISGINAKTIHQGDAWRVNFFRTAGHGDDSKRLFLAWSTIPQGQTFHIPSRFGILRFLK